jgi:hypothetical protein
MEEFFLGVREVGTYGGWVLHGSVPMKNLINPPHLPPTIHLDKLQGLEPMRNLIGHLIDSGVECLCRLARLTRNWPIEGKTGCRLRVDLIQTPAFGIQLACSLAPL